MNIQIITLIIIGMAFFAAYYTSYNNSPYASLNHLNIFHKNYMFIKNITLSLRFVFMVKFLKKTKYDFLEQSIQRLVNYDITSKRAKSSKIATLEDSVIYLVLQEFLHVNINHNNLWAQLHYKNKDELSKGNFKIYVYDITSLAEKNIQDNSNYDEKHKLKKILSFTVKDYRVNNGRKGKLNKTVNLKEKCNK